ncbi:Tellurite resistance protein TehB [hydrothermal vent metagenome]|uniref:Tellurite resistance protein TehB n=1 Tax=hydrothermal vent metagenome TaxID=652676 RepID=A0A3B1AR67_9ZZZZ
MWDKRYATEHYIYGTQPNTFLEQNFTQIPKGKVLCLADGEGRNSVFLAKQGYTVTAVDASAVGIEKAKKLAQDNNVKVNYIHADLATYPLGTEQWDGIVSIFCHLPEKIRAALHSQVVQGLKNTGILLLEAYTPEQLKHGTGGPPTPELTMTANILKKELNGLQFNLLQELERDVVEGSHHTGLGAVVQAIASKKKINH